MAHAQFYARWTRISSEPASVVNLRLEPAGRVQDDGDREAQPLDPFEDEAALDEVIHEEGGWVGLEDGPRVGVQDHWQRDVEPRLRWDEEGALHTEEPPPPYHMYLRSVDDAEPSLVYYPHFAARDPRVTPTDVDNGLVWHARQMETGVYRLMPLTVDEFDLWLDSTRPSTRGDADSYLQGEWETLNRAQPPVLESARVRAEEIKLGEHLQRQLEQYPGPAQPRILEDPRAAFDPALPPDGAVELRRNMQALVSSIFIATSTRQ